jgi:hypothetical protein
MAKKLSKAQNRKNYKKYHSSPARRKYRSELNKERRRRGIYGKGGKEVCHSRGKGKGKVSMCSRKTNRRDGAMKAAAARRRNNRKKK